ncbi:armadillo-type protein [Crepidotus variabilis]|uniref:Armadillo-type protein n=1 Tax=Crepidotus variabilis TaxID=179855 RepID=A0A9P6ENE8_9AGAR|nr:armadillo-type protein [Crepidotus variabilis]
MARPPSYIPLPPPPAWPSLPSDLSSDSAASPAALYYTPPTSPPSPSVYYTPPTSPFNVDPLPFAPSQVIPDIPVSSPSLSEDTFPVPTDVAIDLALDEEGLSTLEKIYLYSRSKAYHHRIFIAHQLREYLDQVSPQEAVEYVLPLLSGLAMDEGGLHYEAVKEALAVELIPVIWWFFTHCQVIPDDLPNEEKYASSSTTVTISVQAFTPILGTLLLNENRRVGILAREAIVGFLARMTRVDERERASKQPRKRRRSARQPAEPTEEEDEPLPYVGCFGLHERALFRQEILQQIVVGLGRLDNEAAFEDERLQDQMSTDTPQSQPSSQTSSPAPASPSAHGDWSNPYFPPVYENSARLSPGGDGSPRRSSPSPLPLSAVQSPNGIQRTISTSSASATQARLDFSPGTEIPPSAERSITSPLLRPSMHDPIAPPSPRRELVSTPNPETPLMNVDAESEEIFEDQGTLGRIACMSLVAAVAAGSPLDDEILESFLDEVERVVHDPYYKVRQAASFALGALAKEIPDSLVPRLLPLFDSLRWDTVWVVRHSALFALPAILDRLTPAQRRTVALETVVALSSDANPTVRTGVLECLGEVIYSFFGLSDGPPPELLKLFLGRPEDKKIRLGTQDEFVDLQTAIQAMTNKAQVTPLESFYIQDKRPLICAFNFPAVVLTIGKERWVEVRDMYLELAKNPNPSVGRTLAASIGEVAKVIGIQYAKADLVDVWWSFVKAPESEVRAKALECLVDFMDVVGVEVAREIVQGLLDMWNGARWNGDVFRGWREREVVMKKLPGWLRFLGLDCAMVVRDLIVKGLEDAAANVREAAISVIPELWALCSPKPDVLEAIRTGIRQLGTSETSRRRMTFIACQQTLVLSVDQNGQSLIPLDDASVRPVADLASDEIEGVRIGVARFTALMYRNLLRHSGRVPKILLDLVKQLKQDASREVRSYVDEVTITESARRGDTPPPERTKEKERKAQVALFSRPPMLGFATSDRSSSYSGAGSQQLSRMEVGIVDDDTGGGTVSSYSLMPSIGNSSSSQVHAERDIAGWLQASAISADSGSYPVEPSLDSDSLSSSSSAISIGTSSYGNRSGLTTLPRMSVSDLGTGQPPSESLVDVYLPAATGTVVAPTSAATPLSSTYEFSPTANEQLQVPV